VPTYCPFTGPWHKDLYNCYGFTIEDKLVPLDFISQLVEIVGAARKVTGENVGGFSDCVDDGLRESTFSQFLADARCNVTPERVATFFMNALVADDGELMGTWHEVEKHGIAVASGSHTELFKSRSGAIDNSISAQVSACNKDADFAGCFALRRLNGARDFGFVQLLKEIAGFHVSLSYQLPLAPPPPKLPPPPLNLPPPPDPRLNPPPPPMGGIHTVRLPRGP
jgi:hypothetical protein